MEFHRRHEAATVGEEEVDVKDLMGLTNEIIPFHMKHNAEPEAVVGPARYCLPRHRVTIDSIDEDSMCGG